MNINREYVQSGFSPDGRRKTGRSRTIHAHNCRLAEWCQNFKQSQGLLGQNLCPNSSGNASHANPVMFEDECENYKQKEEE